MGHALTENRNGLVVDGLVSQATGTAEREAAWLMALQREDLTTKSLWGPTKPTTFPNSSPIAGPWA